MTRGAEDETRPAQPLLPSDLVERIACAHSVGAITGAGVSAESGIQTYRGQGGIYDDPDAGDRTVEALSGPTFRRDPDRTWRAVAAIARQAVDARPNPAHVALAAIERALRDPNRNPPGRFTLLTQNVDGLHREAGSRDPIEIHGTVFATLCTRCGDRRTIDRTFYRELDRAPLCERCEGVLRPAVVLFEEMLPVEPAERAQRELSANPPDLLLVVGTSALFPYIIEPVLLARRAGRCTVEINPEPTLLTSEVEYSMRTPAGRALPAIAELLIGDPG